MVDSTDKLAPIAYDAKLIHLALELKQLGIPWTPHVGCFVHDQQAVITSPSPFPDRIYFILNMQRFIHIFGSVEKMKQQLVWLPTWYQAVQLCHQLSVSDEELNSAASPAVHNSPVDEMVRLYKAMATKLAASSTRSSFDQRKTKDSIERKWARRIQQHELGDITGLPLNVQHRIETLYYEVGRAYLGWRRIQEHQSDTWVPMENTLDPTLLSQLGHFYSDYQHLVKSLSVIRDAAKKLDTIDPSTDPDGYDRLTALLMGAGDSTKPIFETLQALTPTPPPS